MRHLSILLILATLLFPSALVSCGETGRNVSVEEAKKMVDKKGTVILDVRTPQEFAQGHIAGARNINVHDPGFKTKVAEISKKSSILVYCHMGSRSASAQKIMMDSGYGKVFNMLGGFTAWKTKKYPVEE